MLGKCGIMLQEDLLIPDLTVRELLEMVAKLQLKKLTVDERNRRVNEVVEFLGLEDFLDRKIGRVEQGFLSGGQRRRISLAIEGLLSKRRLLFLDEPTTGLSANDACKLLELIYRLAKERGIAIIFSIHQPRWKIFAEYLDKVLLIHNGEMIYFGHPLHLQNYFEGCGVLKEVRPYTNFADIMMDKLADSNCADHLVKCWKNSKQQLDVMNEINDVLREHQVDSDEESNSSQSISTIALLLYEVWELVVNTVKESFILIQLGFRLLHRRKSVFYVSILLEFIYSIFKGFLFINVIDEVDYITDRLSSNFRAVDAGTGLAWLSLYIELLPITDRDFLVGRYGALPYCTMWLVITLTRTIIVSVLNISVYYWISGLQPIFTHFLIYIGISLFFKTAYYSIFICVIACFSSAVLAASVISAIDIFGYVTCSFYVSSDQIFLPLRWTSYVSLYYYTYEALAWTDMYGREFTCNDDGSSQCNPITGEEYLISRNYKNQLSLDFAVLFLYILVPTLIFFLYTVIARIYVQRKSSYLFYSKKAQNLLDEEIQKDNITEIPNDTFLLEQKSTSLNSINDDIMKDILSTSQYLRQGKFISKFDEVFLHYSKDLDDKPEYHQKHSERDNQIILPPLSIHVRNLSFSVKSYQSSFEKYFYKLLPFIPISTNTTILNNINLSVKPGEIISILGPSGSGKSTFLSSMSLSIETGRSRKLYGKIYINGQKTKSNSNLFHLLSYSTQYAEDFVFPSQTVYQNMEFIAQLSFPSSVSWYDKKKIINDTLDALRLTSIRDHIIGPFGARNVSGGQLRRIAIAIDILMRRNRLLLLDEPTSGLSSSGAAELVSILHRMAKDLNYSVVLSIHQPRTEILSLFDKVMIISKGNVVYFDSPQNIINYFEELNIVLPAEESIADSIIDQVINDEIDTENQYYQSNLGNVNEKYQNSRLRLHYLDKTSQDEEIDHSGDNDFYVAKKGASASKLTQIAVLMERSFRVFKLYPLFCFDKSLVMIWTAIVFGIFYLRIPNDAENIQNLTSACILCINFCLYFNLLPMFTYFSEKPIVTHELNSHRYSIVSYWFEIFVIRYFEGIFTSIIFATIVFWLIGFASSFYSYAVFCLAYVFGNWLFISVLFICIWMLKSLSTISLVVSYYLLFFSLDLSGFIVKIEHLPTVVRWMTWLSTHRYVTEVTYYAILSDRSFPCLDDQTSTLDVPCPVSGNDVILLFGYSLNPVLRDILIMFFAGIVLQLIGYLEIRYGRSKCKLLPNKN